MSLNVSLICIYRQNIARKWHPGKETSEKIHEELHFQGVTFILEVECVCTEATLPDSESKSMARNRADSAAT